MEVVRSEQLPLLGLVLFSQDLQLTALKGIINMKMVLPIDGWPVH